MSIQTIPAAEACRTCRENGAVQLIDVRTPAEYEQVHAAGARLLPLDQLSDAAVAQAIAAAGDKPIYVICKSGGRAAKAAEMFQAAGCNAVFSVDGGTSAWEQAGLPVVRGSRKTISIERQVRIAAGALVLVGVALGWFVHPALFGLSAFVGAGLVFAGVTDWCGMGLLMAKMPWNR